MYSIHLFSSTCRSGRRRTAFWPGALGLLLGILPGNAQTPLPGALQPAVATSEAGTRNTGLAVVPAALPTPPASGTAQQSVTPAPTLPRELTLRACLAYADANHPLLKAAQLRRAGSEAFRQYAGVRPNPTVTLQTENWRAWQRPPYNFGRDMDIFLYGSQRFETAGKAARRQEFAARLVDTAQAEVSAVRYRLRQEITRAYWAALHAQTLAEITTENQRVWEPLVQFTAARVREGFTAESELIRAQLEQQTLLGQAAITAQALERAKLDLLKALGETEFDTSFALSAPDEATGARLTPQPLTELQALALAQRPEILRLRAEVESARANLKLQEANARPDWEVSAGFKRTGGLNTALAYVTIPLTLFNQNRGEIGRGAALITAAESELRAEENYIRAEVEAIYRSAQQLGDRLRVLQTDFLKRADQSRDIALVAYREGATDLYKLLETQRARNEARLLYYRTWQEFQAALAELTLTIGGELP